MWFESRGNTRLVFGLTTSSAMVFWVRKRLLGNSTFQGNMMVMAIWTFKRAYEAVSINPQVSHY